MQSAIVFVPKLECHLEGDCMRVFWERTGVLYPIYRLVGQGLSDGEIANKLNLTELKVQSCIAWMLHFLKFTDRKELVHYASPAVVGMRAA
jgi:hypothetical protein